jgi:hypothetical protein
MARANNGGWDFVKVGQQYQYKEDGIIALVTVLEDTSTDEAYNFKVRVDKATFPFPEETFDVMSDKKSTGYYSGMIQFYEQPEYTCNYVWERNEIKNNQS